LEIPVTELEFNPDLPGNDVFGSDLMTMDIA